MSSPPHSSNLRRGRFSEKNRAYLVTFASEGRVRFFEHFSNARLMISVLRSVQHARTLAFVIMPDHVHWLVQLKGGTELSTVVQYVKSVSARRLNKRLGRIGSVWQDGFHDRALRREENLKAVARYIISNPVRAGLVDRAGDYSHWDACWLRSDRREDAPPTGPGG